MQLIPPPNRVPLKGERRLERCCERGRLLSEFLVALGLLFLALVPNLAILHSAARSGEQAAFTARAVYLLREGMELAVNHPGRYLGRVVPETMGAGINKTFDDTFERRISVLNAPTSGLAVATVVVKWGKGSRELVLERYVRTD